MAVSQKTIDVPLTDFADALGSELMQVQEDFQQINYAELLGEFMADLQKYHAGYFAEEREPGGGSWSELAPSTIKKKGHDRILVETAKLRDSLASVNQVSIREVVAEGGNVQGLSFGTSREWAHVHQEGTDKIPQRTHTGIGDRELEEMAGKVIDEVTRKLQR